MTAEEFARLLNGKKVGKKKWVARCVAHPDRTPSLSIAEGRKTPIVMRCMSQGCTAESILGAMGLRWSDVMGERAMTPAIKAELLAKDRLRLLETRWAALVLLHASRTAPRAYWAAAERRAWAEMEAHRDTLDPERLRRRKMDEAIRRHGWDTIWERFLKTDKGQQLSAQFSLDSFTWTPSSALPTLNAVP